MVRPRRSAFVAPSGSSGSWPVASPRSVLASPSSNAEQADAGLRCIRDGPRPFITCALILAEADPASSASAIFLAEDKFTSPALHFPFLHPTVPQWHPLSILGL
jgi:hypothetical protein